VPTIFGKIIILVAKAKTVFIDLLGWVSSFPEVKKLNPALTFMKWLSLIQNNFFPPTCILCDNLSFSDKDLCQYCCNQLVKNYNPCYQCGTPLTQFSEQNTHCSSCLQLPPSYNHTFAPFLHQGIIRHLVTRLKFNDHYKNARLLGTLLAEQLPTQTALPECIIPVPLHKNRYQQRGFNQSIEIAKTVSRQLNVPLELNACIRHRDTPHQVGLTAQQRLLNVKDAFSIQKPLPFSYVAVLDDVMTAGATLNEVATVLKKAGVQKVDVWVCARAY
jgi:ComF family protein